MTRRREPIEVVLSGGPCGGKTTALAILSEKIADWGFRVLVAPEVATLLIRGGIHDIGEIAADPERFRILEGHFLAFQRALRTRYRALAEAFPDQQVVILYDRGEADISAYLEPAVWARILLDAGLSTADVRDSYDAVIHLVTAADGAEHAYTTANNLARRETPAEARAMDARTMAAWVGHPRLRVIDNSTDFEAKMHRTLAAIARVIGVPEPVEIERKFLLAAAPSREVLVSLHATAVEIEQVYLLSPDDRSIRVRRRGVGANAMFYRTAKITRSNTTRIENQTAIGRHEYIALLAQSDPARRPIRKVRHCFVRAGTYFELDEFQSPAGLWILEVELAHELDQIRLPEELAIDREVTDEPGWGNADLARVV